MPLNVATPLTAFTVVVTPGGVEVSVTGAVDVKARLPVASCTWTTTAGIGNPAVLLGNVEVNASCAAGAHVAIVNNGAGVEVSANRGIAVELSVFVGA